MYASLRLGELSYWYTCWNLFDKQFMWVWAWWIIT